jgi:hypothetical protein
MGRKEPSQRSLGSRRGRCRVTKVELYDVGCISPVSASKKKPMEKESAFFTMNA